ncbi:MAG: TfoX/Sxy family protein [Demequinaceae bacterium]|nr:TfoX/Sxy family protein [Demequinaceae bacterium]
MATRRETIDYLLEQLEPLKVRARAMFGEYCLYCDGKVIALVCDETFFLKPTLASDDRGLREAEAYSGSKPYRVIEGDLIEDSDGLRVLVQATADALPAPKPKRPRTARPLR